jgi:hypothetical protein
LIQERKGCAFVLAANTEKKAARKIVSLLRKGLFNLNSPFEFLRQTCPHVLGSEGFSELDQSSKIPEPAPGPFVFIAFLKGHAVRMDAELAIQLQ